MDKRREKKQLEIILYPCHEAPIQAPVKVKLNKIFSVSVMNKMDGRKIEIKFCHYSHLLHVNTLDF